MGNMLEDYDHLLNIDHDRPYQIEWTRCDSLITMAGRRSEKLDGIWNFAPDVFDTFLRKKFFEEIYVDDQGRDKPVDCDFDQWEQVWVPSNWNVQKERYWFFEGSGIYTRKFQYHKGEDSEKVFLRIGAANYESRIWLNGTLIARHEGGFTPYMVEITQYLEEKNRIIIMVNNERKLNQIPSVNYDWMNYGGISRSIELVRLPKAYIKDAFIHLVPGTQGRKISAKIRTMGFEAGTEVKIEIPDLSVEETVRIDETGYASVIFDAMPDLWSPEKPVLYRVDVACETDQIQEKIGFREIAVEGKKVSLNGNEIFLKGVCCHEESMENGRALTEEERIRVLKTAKEMGCNVMRLSHYPHSERMAELADEMGIMLWEEIPVYWALEFENPKTFANAGNQLQEMILRDRNRASVILWGIGNENPDTDERLAFMKKLAGICKDMDETRLTAAACLVNIDAMEIQDRLCQWIDVVAINEYYGWYYRDYDGLSQIFANTSIDKPIVISETGADAVCGHYGDEEELFTENHQAKMYCRQFEMSEGEVQGIFPWILFDFRSPVRLNPLQDSFNRKGLMGADQSYKKMAYEVVKAYYEGK